ncbi:FAA hydrolase family protein [Alicyclobacillaceae bacterium I2511]|nr:FAA hydrolase family protein [Alicyclobacillaceae bacterium I2511]
MKLLNMRVGELVHLGVRDETGVMDLTATAKSLGSSLPTCTDELLAMGDVGLAAAQRVFNQAVNHPEGASWHLQESDVQFAPAVLHPQKIVCVGTNYRKHAMESHMPIPTSPVVFSKFNNTLAGHGESVKVPKTTEKLDYEVELVVVIGKTAQDVSREQALSYVAGYCTGNDLSARDLQMRTGQWLLGKSCDGFAPLGPYLVTADEVSNPNDLALECQVNGEVRQSSNTRDMIFDCAELVSYISRHITLQPGDILFTGTPEGVILGYPLEQQKWLQAGDEITVSVAGLGELHTVLVN